MSRVKKVDYKIPPHLKKLAEDEIAVQFLEQPGLEAEVKGKIADVIGNSGTRLLVDSKVALQYLKKNLGVGLAAIVSSIEEEKYNTFVRPKNPEKLSSLQNRNVAAAYVILEILLSSMSRSDVIDWLTSYSDYLYGIPAIEIHKRPEDVRTAALSRIMEQ